MASRTHLRGDLALALASIAADLGLDVEDVPDSVAATLRALSVAHYNAGVQDGMSRASQTRPLPSDVVSSNVTPVVGPHGRRRLLGDNTVPLSRRPTPMLPPPKKEPR